MAFLSITSSNQFKPSHSTVHARTCQPTCWGTLILFSHDLLVLSGPWPRASLVTFDIILGWLSLCCCCGTTFKFLLQELNLRLDVGKLRLEEGFSERGACAGTSHLWKWFMSWMGLKVNKNGISRAVILLFLLQWVFHNGIVCTLIFQTFHQMNNHFADLWNWMPCLNIQNKSVHYVIPLHMVKLKSLLQSSKQRPCRKSHKKLITFMTFCSELIFFTKLKTTQQPCHCPHSFN